ncbi:MAG: hypothetical protein AB1749_16330 [Pseudomonadota bacterium]
MTVAFGWWFLLLQTFLLMLAAFLIGAMFACVARRAFYDLPEGEQVQVKPSAERPPAPPASAPAAAAVKPQPAAVTSSVPPVTPRSTVPPPKPAPPAPPVGAPVAAAATRAAPAPSAAPPATAPPPPASPLPSGRQLDTARFERALTGQGTAQPSVSPAKLAEPQPADAAKAAAAAVAASTATVVTSVPAVAKPAPATTSAMAPGSAPAPSRPITVQAPSAGGSGGPASVAAEVVTAPPADDLTRIRTIDAMLARTLAAAGITRYQQIADWTAADVAATTSRLGLGQRISRENWIEQAQVLAKGQETAYARRRRRGEAAVAAPTPAPAPAPTPMAARVGKPAAAATAAAPPAARPSAPTAAAAVAGVAAPVVQAAPPPAGTAAPKPAAEATPPRAPDDLQRIRGITPDIMRVLAASGVTRFADIAAWTAGDVARFDQLLGQRGQIARGNWIEQAHILARGSTTTYSRSAEARQRVAASVPAEPEPSRPARLSDAIKEQSERTPAEARAGRPDVAGLRSVRSELLVGDGGETQARVPIGRVGAGNAVDDLKRIRGIGVLIEKKLNSLGVARYDQIANWTGADIDRMSQLLDFRGRIERENWVEQARILASGGQTEFSRRVDKGDVESSRDPSRG